MKRRSQKPARQITQGGRHVFMLVRGRPPQPHDCPVTTVTVESNVPVAGVLRPGHRALFGVEDHWETPWAALREPCTGTMCSWRWHERVQQVSVGLYKWTLPRSTRTHSMDNL